MNQKTSKTWTATIWIAGNIQTIELTCREFVERGLCVTVTPTTFVFTGGSETGASVGIIQYPRFETTEEKLRGTALELAELLCQRCFQLSVSVVMPDETVWLYKESKEKSKTA